MAHSCPECDETCYCDLEDAFTSIPSDCRHICEEDDPDPDWNDFDDGTRMEE
jgi:hypothetical protein